MFVFELEGVELDRCAGCEGTWFDRGELILLFEEFGEAARALSPEKIDALPAAETAEQPRACPICRKTMRKLRLGDAPPVLVDQCPRGHGLWFDRDEVADLTRGLVDKMPEAPARALDFMGRAFELAAGPDPEQGES